MTSSRTTALVAVALLTACGDDHGDERSHDPAAEACAAFVGAATPVTAAADRAAAPTLPLEQAVRVTLPPAAEGWLTLEGPGDRLLFSELANVVTGLYDDAAATSVLPQGSPNADCPQKIADHFDLALSGAGPWRLKLGPSAVTEAWLYLTPAAGHGAH